MSVVPIQQVPQVRPRPLHPVEPAVRRDDATTALSAETGELHRWLWFLLPPLTISAVFFALAIGTGVVELIGAALFFGPMLMILAFIYLGLSSDSNSA